MMTEQQMRMMIEMFSNPMFKSAANEFLNIAQQHGLNAANQFWGINSKKEAFPNAEKIMEGLAEFYQALGFVTQAKYDELMQQYTNLKAENQVLSDTISQLQQRFIAENGAKAQQAWQEIVDKQLKMSRDVTQSFFDVLKQSSPEKGQ